MTNDEAKKFIIMRKAGVFELESGKAEININGGHIQNIHTEKMTYKREKVI